MAECHPVGFQWVMEAKERGARVIHVDPRFTRSSALAHDHVPIRVGTDIVFLGALINHVLQGGHEFREYVAAYTNAATLVTDEFRDTEDLDGLFSGWDPESQTYDVSTWRYQGPDAPPEAGDDSPDPAPPNSAGEQSHGAHGARVGAAAPATDPTLESPRCVFQILKRHYE